MAVEADEFVFFDARDAALPPVDEGQLASAVDVVLAKVKTAIGTDRAVAMCLGDPPLGSRNPDTLNKATTTVIMALTGCPDNKMKDAVEALSPPQQTLLMQYIYRGMAQRNEAVSSVLLKWHAAVIAAAGEGCIVRAMSARPTVLDLPSMPDE